MSHFTADSSAAAVLREALTVKAEIAELSARLDVLTKDGLAKAGTGKHTVEGVGSFTVSEVNVYSKDVMTNLLAKGQFNLVSERVVNNAKVKALFPEIYAAAKDSRGLKVTL